MCRPELIAEQGIIRELFSTEQGFFRTEQGNFFTVTGKSDRFFCEKFPAESLLPRFRSIAADTEARMTAPDKKTRRSKGASGARCRYNQIGSTFDQEVQEGRPA
jgi:hypothetical protein